LNQLEYLDWQDPKEILIGVGIFAASPRSIDAINAVNKSKEKFKAAMLAMKNNKIQLNNIDLNDCISKILKTRSNQLANCLKRIGLARLHLKQCYRKIPVLTKKPEKVAWTWANTRAITKISVAKAYELLSKQPQDLGIQQQLKKLINLEENTPLAIIQELAPHLRTNIVSKEHGTAIRKMIKGAVPIFYLDDNSGQLPHITPPKNKHARDNNRLIRKDMKINPEPFLPAIRVHSYL
jgi:hypothetical protein